MKVKFFADHHNARFTWGWVNGEHVTEDAAEIENLQGIGLRFEEVAAKKPRKTSADKPADKPEKKSAKWFGKNKD